MSSVSSQEEEDEADVQTEVLLGYASEETVDDDAISQLGGFPSWLEECATPSADFARCRVCNGLMVLLLQLNGDMPSRFPNHERRLYLFACRRKPCRRKPGSIRGFRATRVLPSNEASKLSVTTTTRSPVTNLGSVLFGGATDAGSVPVNPFSVGSSSGDSKPKNPFATTKSASAASAQSSAESTAKDQDMPDSFVETFASKVRLNSPQRTDTAKPHEPWPEQSEFPRPYSKYALDAEYESIPLEDKSVSSKAQIEIDANDDSRTTPSRSSEAGGEDKELFESSMDTTFQKFADRLSHNPDQVLRYEFGGSPLLYSSTDDVGRRLHRRASGLQDYSQPLDSRVMGSSAAINLPSCANCRSDRVFELQLTPHAITMLEEDEPASAAFDGMDWGTVLMGVCKADCIASTTTAGQTFYVEEWTAVQWEET